MTLQFEGQKPKENKDKGEKMELIVAILGAVVSIAIACIGALMANRNSIILQTRKLREDHCITYIEALHNLATNNKNEKFNLLVPIPMPETSL